MSASIASITSCDGSLSPPYRSDLVLLPLLGDMLRLGHVSLASKMQSRGLLEDVRVRPVEGDRFCPAVHGLRVSGWVEINS